MLESGFVDWSFEDYRRFIKAFKKKELGDLDGIAVDVGTKSREQI